MPVLQSVTTPDSITPLVSFRPSLLVELVLAPYTLLESRRHEPWQAIARDALPASFWPELDAVYAMYHQGASFLELPVDYGDQADVPGFLAYLEAMPAHTFLFYILGRVIPEDVLAAAPLSAAGLTALRQDNPDYARFPCCEPAAFAPILDNVPVFQRRLAGLWRAFWTAFLSAHTDDLRDRWQQAILQKEDVLRRMGGTGLLEYVTGHDTLPEPLPPGQPYDEVVFTPVYFTPRAKYMYFGYGNVTVLFDTERTEARGVAIEQAKDAALAAFKALGDANRLRILRLIAHKEGSINGKKLAAVLNLSPSAVSRHLAQLRDGGLILEETEDNRNITYRLQKDVIRELPDKLFDYLFS